MSERNTGPSVPPLPANWEYMSGVSISDGRLFPRKDERKKAGIGEDDVVAVIIETDETAVVVGERVVQSGGRIGIPQRIVEARGLEGENVGLWVSDTGIDYE